MQTLPIRMNVQTEMYRKMMDQVSTNLRVSCPGIIQSFDPITQTATIQLSINERINLNGDLSWEQIPVILDVPLVTIRGGGHLIVTAINPGDECFVWFADMCIDAAWQSGGINNIQMDRRRHDLSDAFFIPSLFSQPKKISNYPTQGIQLRNDTGTSVIEVNGSTINITGGTVNVNSNGNTTIDGKNFLAHTHPDAQGGTTGSVS
jgi:hypothetical protein